MGGLCVGDQADFHTPTSGDTLEIRPTVIDYSGASIDYRLRLQDASQALPAPAHEVSRFLKPAGIGMLVGQVGSSSSGELAYIVDVSLHFSVDFSGMWSAWTTSRIPSNSDKHSTRDAIAFKSNGPTTDNVSCGRTTRCGFITALECLLLISWMPAIHQRLCLLPLSQAKPHSRNACQRSAMHAQLKHLPSYRLSSAHRAISFIFAFSLRQYHR